MRLKRLEKMIGKERDGTERSRLQAAKMRKEGMSIRGIAGGLCKPYSTVRDWLVRMHRKGPRGRYNKRRGRRKRILDNQILRKLKGWLAEGPAAHGFKSSDWHLDMILELLKRKAGVECSGRTLTRALRRVHLSYRKRSRPVPHNSVSEEEQEAFMAGARIAELRGLRYAVFAGDEWSSQMWTGNGYVWRPAGGRDIVMTRLAGGTVKAFCALGEGSVCVMPADSANSEEFLRFVRAVRERFYCVIVTCPKLPTIF